MGMMRRVAAAAIAAVIGASHSAAGQAVVTPSSHFGALMYPEFEPMGQLGLHFDRFTEFDGDTAADGSYRLVPYNGLRRTIGLNLAAFSSTGRIAKRRRLMYRATVQIGASGDQPTRFFQNNVIHAIRGFTDVPVGRTRSRFPEGGVAVDLNQWIPLPKVRVLGGRLDPPVFLGGGVSFSTVNSEAFLQAGWRAVVAGPSAMIRVGQLVGGDAFPDAVVARGYRLVNLSFRLPTDRLFDWVPWLGGTLPEIEATYTWSTGLFVTPAGERIPEEFCGIRLSWQPLTFETWNDLCNGKDKGPSYGLRIYARSVAFSLSSWIH